MILRLLFYFCRTCAVILVLGLLVAFGAVAYHNFVGHFKEVLIAFGGIMLFVCAIVGMIWDGPDSKEEEHGNFGWTDQC